jgi:hypothetical protein
VASFRSPPPNLLTNVELTNPVIRRAYGASENLTPSEIKTFERGISRIRSTWRWLNMGIAVPPFNERNDMFVQTGVAKSGSSRPAAEGLPFGT